jgi:hypothetical protein
VICPIQYLRRIADLRVFLAHARAQVETPQLASVTANLSHPLLDLRQSSLQSRSELLLGGLWQMPQGVHHINSSRPTPPPQMCAKYVTSSLAQNLPTACVKEQGAKAGRGSRSSQDLFLLRCLHIFQQTVKLARVCLHVVSFLDQPAALQAKSSKLLIIGSERRAYCCHQLGF